MGKCHWREVPQVSFLSRQTRVLSQQKYACRGKTFVATNIILSQQKFCHNKLTFVATNTCLSRQKKKKKILVAAPANDREELWGMESPLLPMHAPSPIPTTTPPSVHVCNELQEQSSAIWSCRFTKITTLP